MDFGEQMNDLVIQKKNVVMDSMQPGGGALTVFAIPVKQKSYKGFDYCAIAISYNNEDMEQVLDVLVQLLLIYDVHVHLFEF